MNHNMIPMTFCSDLKSLLRYLTLCAVTREIEMELASVLIVSLWRCRFLSVVGETALPCEFRMLSQSIDLLSDFSTIYARLVL